MTSKKLSRLLRPKSVAVVGGAWALAAAQSSLRMKYKGDVWLVNTSRKSAAGLKCHRAISELPRAPDAVFVGVNRKESVRVVGELSEAGCGGAVCFASGFGEADGGKLQNELVRAAGDMPVLGPNCYGFINYLDGALLWPDAHGGKREQRGAAIISQSSNIAINLTMHRRGLPLSYVVCAGNQAQTTIADIGYALLEDKRVTAIGMYLEGVGDARAFASFANVARQKNVGVVALKTGRSKQSRLAAAAHTASLSGEAETSSAFLQKCGIAEVQSLPQLMEALKLLHTDAAPKKRALVAFCCSGGEAGLMADAAAKFKIKTPQPSAKAKRGIKKHLGALVRPANPLDYHTFIWGDGAAKEKTFSLAMADGYPINILVLDYPRESSGAGGGWTIAADALCRAAKKVSTPCAVLATLPENINENEARRLMNKGVAPLAGIDDALGAIAALAEVNENNNGAHNWLPLPALAAGKGEQTDEANAKLILKNAGLKTPSGLRAQTPKQTAAAARKLLRKCGAVVVKGLGFAHKTENNALRLNVRSANEAEAAAKKMRAPRGFLVEEMIDGALGEVLLCARRDDVYGATLTLATGGVYVETINDAVTVVLPAAKKEIRAALASLRLPLRGKSKPDMNAATNAAFALAKLIIDNDDILEMEVNPLLLMPGTKGAAAADALATLRKGKRQ